MISVTKDPAVVSEAISPYEKMTGKTDATDWLSKEENLAFTDGEGNVGLLQYDRPGVYNAHLFLSVKGRKAIELAKAMMFYAFDNYPVEVMRGYTPLTNRAARWIDRQLGFTSYGALPTVAPPCELFILTKQEFGAKHGFSFRR